jgi:DNA helicase HerA-like ATPase
MISLAGDVKTRQNITVSTAHSRAIFISGKRGSGKSYTLGKIVEEVYAAGRHLIVVVDPLSVFWSTAIPLNGDEGVPVRVLVPGDPDRLLGALAQVMTSHGLEVQRLWLNPSDLTADAWLSLFKLSLADPQGIVLSRALRSLGDRYALDDLIAQVELDERASARTVEAIANRLDGSKAWGLFADTYRPMMELLQAGVVNVLDLSGLDPGPLSLRNLVVQLLTDELFRTRLLAYRLEQVGLTAAVPPVFLAIDEAHNFCPATGQAFGKAPLIRYVKEGRAADMSLAVATQQPSALGFDLISQCDVLVIHRLTAADDVKMVSRLASTYASAIPAYLKGCVQPGVAVIVDDLEETMAVGRVRARTMYHGAEALPGKSRPVGTIDHGAA